ncbi:MAG: right-handed parallel beta-helix repeat-containing protein, partial [Planctomycetia bacterium]|nr:right-handed parallel beta-helix repeat-containing protein [Planctomycetia bacterium]
KAITVTVKEGLYELDSVFTLTAEDSGTENLRVTWQGEKGKTVRLSAGKYLNSWKKVDDAEILAQLPESVRDKVVMVDLKAAGITEYGSPKGGGIELFFKGKPMTMSRYPNEGFIKIVSVDENEPRDVRGTKGDGVGNFQVDDERILAWDAEKDPWVHGYWFWDWSEERHAVAEIVKETKTIKVAPKYHSYGYRKGQWFYGFNLLCEIDMPGEYYVDRETGILYFYPPEEVTEDSLVVTVLGNVVKVRADYLTFKNFVLEYSRDTAFSMNGKGDLAVKMTVRNASGTGISANGTNMTVYGCHLFNLGKSGISMTGGDRKTLTPSGNLVANCEIHDYARIQRVYAPGVQINGVGNTVAYCKIYDAPHMGIGFGGNDNLIEYNEIYNVCYESNDAGAIYTGRNWTMRGNVLRYNYLHDIQGFENRGCVGIYLDDQFSSAEMRGNIFVRVSRATMIGGGRDSQIVNNIYIDCQPCVHLDARGLGWQKAFTEGWIKDLQENSNHLGINPNVPPYSTKYPEVTEILTNNPGTPVGNTVANNLYIRGNFGATTDGQWKGTSIWQKAPEFNTIENNREATESELPGWKEGDFTLSADSPSIQTGFQQIPWREIGLKKDALRARTVK